MASHAHPRLTALLVAGAVLIALALPATLALGLVALTSSPPSAPGNATATGIPARAAQAYQAAGGRCAGLDWTLLAAIGAVETDHGRTGATSVHPDTGEAIPWIYGPSLDGHNGTVALPVGPWTSWWGLTGPWQHAVGPMQFLPLTFTAHAVDADADGTANPHDIDDAVATTAAYICSTAGETVDGPDEVARIYNPGDATAYATKLAAEQQRIHAAAQHLPAAATMCPVAGPVTFTDTWQAPRSGGRRHQGVDMFADEGTPVVAVAPGRVEHSYNDLGGLSYRLYADDGTYYYGTHLSAYANEGADHVDGGTVIGYVGRTGNAATTPPHLHWEVRPAGRGTPAVNPTPTANAVCSVEG